jgi:hypothetical protein
MRIRWVVLIGLAAFVAGILGAVFAGPPLVELGEYLVARNQKAELYELAAQVESENPDIIVVGVTTGQLDATTEMATLWIMWDSSLYLTWPPELRLRYASEMFGMLYPALADLKPGFDYYTIRFCQPHIAYTTEGPKTIVISTQFFVMSAGGVEILGESTDKETALRALEDADEFASSSSQLPVRSILPRPPGYPWPWE